MHFSFPSLSYFLNITHIATEFHDPAISAYWTENSRFPYRSRLLSVYYYCFVIRWGFWSDHQSWNLLLRMLTMLTTAAAMLTAAATLLRISETIDNAFIIIISLQRYCYWCPDIPLLLPGSVRRWFRSSDPVIWFYYNKCQQLMHLTFSSKPAPFRSPAFSEQTWPAEVRSHPAWFHLRQNGHDEGRNSLFLHNLQQQCPQHLYFY